MLPRASRLLNDRKRGLTRRRPSLLGGVFLAFATLGAMAAVGIFYQRRAEASPQSQQAKSGLTKETAADLYQHFCQRCHRKDGKGERGAGGANVPDFSAARFLERRSDAQLVVSILDGKGDGMPAFHGKVTEAQARTLAAYVRSFVSEHSPDRARDEKTRQDFEKQLQKLQEELEDLRTQFERLGPKQSRAEDASSIDSAQTKAGEDSRDGLRGAVKLYRCHCQRCHGADGKGDGMTSDGIETPDFTSRAWQRQQSDARLLTSLLEGKKGMPAFEKKLSKEEAELLVEFIRAFKQPRKSAPAKTRTSEGG